ncbi:MAG: saccharopine dehydrogenase NADP-binding domain-containing protein [Pelagibacterales bacterium]|nr:saccharopine dehydrogenase NADP-binding domain-containing protein [Pelagibacterales bacterium]
MKNILVLGLGKVGSLVGTLLSSKFNVKGLDQNKPHYNYKLSFDVIQGDVADLKSMKSILKDFDAVVSALPFFLNKNIAKLAHDLNLHYFDLTEDVKTTKYIKKLSKTAKKIMAPQCGLAPGLIGIIGNDLAMQFDELRDNELRVGALPRKPKGQLAYSITW